MLCKLSSYILIGTVKLISGTMLDFLKQTLRIDTINYTSQKLFDIEITGLSPDRVT